MSYILGTEMINYRALNDADKLDLLRLLYHDAKKLKKDTKDIVAETQLVYSRIKRNTI